MPKISTILDQIENGSISLPVFQRGFVWSRKQVQNLFSSLYKEHPVGSLLVWQTSSMETETRGNVVPPSTPLHLLLDGQQRITSLYGVIRGSEPAFFQGNERAFTDLRFHLEKETFEFYQPIKMRDDPLWIDVTIFFADWGRTVTDNLKDKGIDSSRFMETYQKLLGIPNRELHIEHVTGENKSVDIVVEIFNQVNSGGTKLTRGDLALAKICADWPDAREEMLSKLKKWEAYGFDFELDWLLRVINAIVTGEAKFSFLRDVSRERIQEGIQKAEKYIDITLKIMRNRIGLDHTQVLFAKPAIVVIASILDTNEGNLSDEDWSRLLYWYVNTGMWGRYSGTVETILDHDLGIVQNANSPSQAIQKLIEALQRSRGSLRVTAQNFHGSTRGSRFYSVLYMMTRMSQARDFIDGSPLMEHRLGKMAQLELHHIFPKSQLKKSGHSKETINALANFCFLTNESNQILEERLPPDYLPEVEIKYPRALESQWIPMETDLWELKNYNKFLEKRKRLLALAANKFLDNLRFNRHKYWINNGDWRNGITIDEEELQIDNLNKWVHSKGLLKGKPGYELVNQNTGDILVTFDLAWPEGVQAELSEPVAVHIGGGAEELLLIGKSANGYRCFTDIEEFKAYINDEILLTSLEESTLLSLIRNGESETLEFKSTLRYNINSGSYDKKIEHAVIKTIAGFLNTDGGILLIGIDDDGNPVDTKVDGFETEDRAKLHLVNLVKDRIGPEFMTMVRLNSDYFQGFNILRVFCEQSHSPVYVRDGKDEVFYVRLGPSTDKLPTSKIAGYIKRRFE